jgi:hypothetical protein
MKLGALVQVPALAVLLFVPAYCIGQTTAPSAPPGSQTASSLSTNTTGGLTPRELSSQLAQLDKQLKIKPSKEQFADLQRALPSDWQIQTPDRTYSVSTQPLRRLLNPDNLDDARAYIATLREQLDTGETVVPASSNARAELDRILADSRFHQVRQPSPWELWRQRVNAWLLRQVQKLVLAVARHPIGAKFVFWLVLAGAVTLLAFVIYRMFMRNDRIDSLHPEAVRMRSRSWQEWIRAAREFAARGDYREAIHATYWAGIKRLQDANALPLDRAKTPREYLRALAAPRAPEQESNEKYKDPLAKLTTNLELAWYANRRAGSAEFAETLQQAEALGCRLD